MHSTFYLLPTKSEHIMHHNRTLSSCRVSCHDVSCVDSFMNGSLMKRNQLKLLLVRRLSVNMQFATTTNTVLLAYFHRFFVRLCYFHSYSDISRQRWTITVTTAALAVAPSIYNNKLSLRAACSLRFPPSLE